MLAQWVPLHAVSCSNLIETGGCAESREIPLRVTQTCSGCCSLRRSHRSRLATNRQPRSRAVGPDAALALAWRVRVALVNDRARSSTYPENASSPRKHALAFKTVDHGPRNARVFWRQFPAAGNRPRSSHSTLPRFA